MKDLTKVCMISFIVGFTCSTLGHYIDYNSNVKRIEASSIELISALAKNPEIQVLKYLDSKPLLKLPMETKVELAKTIVMMCRAKNIPIPIVLAIIEKESDFNPKAKSKVALGLMQVVAIYGLPYLEAERIEVAKEKLLDPVINVIVGISMLAHMHNELVAASLCKQNDFTLTLETYNKGPASAIANKEAGRPSLYAKDVLLKAQNYANI